MDRRVAIAGLLALVVVLSGCQFGGAGTGTSADDSMATETPHPFGESSPPGADETGVTDVDALMDAHAASLEGTTSTVDVEFHLTVNETGQNVSLRGKTSPGTDRGWMKVELADGVGTYYTDNGTTYYRENVDERVRYGTTGDVSAIPEQPRFGADERIRTALESAEWEPAGTVERDGRTLLELEATSVDPPNVNTTDDTTISSSGRLLVDSDGVVHAIDVSTKVETDRGTVRYGLSVVLSDVGSTTIDRPEWFEQAA